MTSHSKILHRNHLTGRLHLETDLRSFQPARPAFCRPSPVAEGNLIAGSPSPQSSGQFCSLRARQGLGPADLLSLEERLEGNVFGQHLVTRLVTRAVRAHVRKSEPKKALVMSFHGWTGSGKNFVAKFIVESLFKLGLNSKFVHLFISTLHFPNKDMSDIYKLRVQDWIRGNVTDCQSSVFIFDEIDKMPEGMIDGIKPFIDHHHMVEGQNFRKSIFIFLSNTGGKQITEQTYQFWREGRQREDITYSDLEKLVNEGAFNE